MPNFQQTHPSQPLLRRRKLRLAMPLAVLWLGACAALPDGQKPAPLAAPPLAFTRSIPAGQNPSPPDSPPADWWQAAGDPQLAALIEEGLRSGPSVATAAARYRNAMGLAGQAGAALLPSLSVEAKGGYAKQSYNVGFPKQFVPKGWQESAQISGGFSFDLDLWGRNRAALRAATSEARAAELDAQQARLMLSTAIANGYIELARLIAERDVRAALVASSATVSTLSAQRFANGLENRGGLSLSEAAAANARADLAGSEAAITLRRHQLAALVGAGPDRGLTINPPPLAKLPAASLPEGLTTDLIGRRPDIAAARARAEAAASRVHVAKADFFPAINLGAMVGLQSLGFANLLETDAMAGNAGPALTLPLFRGGALRGRYRSAQAGYDAALADYTASVVNAYQQVADAVASRAALASRLADARKALAAAEIARSIAHQRYTTGLSTRLDDLSVEDRLLQSRLAVAALEAASHSADIALIQSLGGGFAAASVFAKNAPSKDTPHG